MSLQRSTSVRVADIVIPESLIATTRGGPGWTPYRQQQELAGHGPVQTTIRRTASQRYGHRSSMSALRPQRTWRNSYHIGSDWVSWEAEQDEQQQQQQQQPQPHYRQSSYRQSSYRQSRQQQQLQPQQQQRHSAMARPRKTSEPITLEEEEQVVRNSPTLSLDKSHHFGLDAPPVAISDRLSQFRLSSARFSRMNRYSASKEQGRTYTYDPNNCYDYEYAIYDTEESSGDEEPNEKRQTVRLREDPDVIEPVPPAHLPRRSVTLRRLRSVLGENVVSDTLRAKRSSIYETYERAKMRGAELEREPWARALFEYTIYLALLCFVYFVLIGMPLWKGAVYWLYWVFANKLTPIWGWSITLGIAILMSFAPLLVLFEPEPSRMAGSPSAVAPLTSVCIGTDYRPGSGSVSGSGSGSGSDTMVDPDTGLDPRLAIPGVRDTALLIPCYKSASIIGPTLEAALHIFPPSHIFVIANGNSPTPLDNTEEVCRPYGVNHIWSPVGSKIVAQFVGCHAARSFRTVLLIDDDCALPPHFPVASDRLVGRVQCIGYTIKSVGPDGTRGSWCQQAQDLEYKISGLQRTLAGKLGSATFPHGAISLWDRRFLVRTFHDHPGFSVSEDWFFGHSCRRLGGRIKMCTAVFVETETPANVFFSAAGGSRGGFGEMTVFKQRFLRWNFFFVNGMWYNLVYVLTSWKLGWWELGAKLFVFQEVYETLLYLLAPFVLPISFIVRPAFSSYMLAATVGLYYVNVVLFNLIHLRRRNESVSWTICLLYYMPYKMALTVVNVASCYWSLFKYARYFAKRHPKVIEDEKAVEVVLRLDETVPVNPFDDKTYSDNEDSYSCGSSSSRSSHEQQPPPPQPQPQHHLQMARTHSSNRDSTATVANMGRRMTVTAVHARVSVDLHLTPWEAAEVTAAPPPPPPPPLPMHSQISKLSRLSRKPSLGTLSEHSSPRSQFSTPPPRYSPVFFSSVAAAAGTVGATELPQVPAPTRSIPRPKRRGRLVKRRRS